MAGEAITLSRIRRASRAIFCGLLPNLGSQEVCGSMGRQLVFLHYTCSGTTQGFR